jgi:hypothetical protein
MRVATGSVRERLREAEEFVLKKGPQNPPFELALTLDKSVREEYERLWRLERNHG